MNMQIKPEQFSKTIENANILIENAKYPNVKCL